MGPVLPLDTTNVYQSKEASLTSAVGWSVCSLRSRSMYRLAIRLSSAWMIGASRSSAPWSPALQARSRPVTSAPCAVPAGLPSPEYISFSRWILRGAYPGEATAGAAEGQRRKLTWRGRWLGSPKARATNI